MACDISRHLQAIDANLRRRALVVSFDELEVLARLAVQLPAGGYSLGRVRQGVRGDSTGGWGGVHGADLFEDLGTAYHGSP